MEDKHLCLAKEKKKNQTCKLLKSAVLTLKIVCILNGVCCAIVHSHCINVKTSVAENLNVRTKSEKT